LRQICQWDPELLSDKQTNENKQNLLSIEWFLFAICAILELMTQLFIIFQLFFRVSVAIDITRIIQMLRHCAIKLSARICAFSPMVVFNN